MHGCGLQATDREGIDDGVAAVRIALHQQTRVAGGGAGERARDASVRADDEGVANGGIAGEILEILEVQHRRLGFEELPLVLAGDTPDRVGSRPGQRVGGAFSALHGVVVEHTLGDSRGRIRTEIDGDSGLVLGIVEGVLAILAVNGAAEGGGVGKREHVLAARADEILDIRKPDVAEQRALVELGDCPGVVGSQARDRVASRAAIDRDIAVRERGFHHCGIDYHGIVAPSQAQADLGVHVLRHDYPAEGGDLAGAEDVDGPGNRARLQADGVVRRGGDHGQADGLGNPRKGDGRVGVAIDASRVGDTSGRERQGLDRGIGLQLDRHRVPSARGILVVRLSGERAAQFASRRKYE